MNTIIIPRLDLREATIQEALNFLKSKSIELDRSEWDPTKRGVNIARLHATLLPEFVVVPGLTESTPAIVGRAPKEEKTRITISVSNIPLIEALRYVTAAADLRFRVEPNFISVTPRSMSDVLVTRQWKLNDRMIFARRLTRVLEPEKMLLFEGISFPPGAAVYWIARSQRLIMTNTQENLDRVDALIFGEE